MTQLTTKIPYDGTKISTSQSKIDIEAMIKEFGAEAMRWTETPDSMQGKDLPILEFIIKTEIKGVEKHLGFRIKPPLFMQRKRRHGRSGPMVETPAPNQSMRLLWWWLKAKLEGVRFGLESIEETLLSKVLVSLPSGEIKPAGEIIIPQLISQEGKGLSMLPEFEIKQRPREGEVVESQ